MKKWHWVVVGLYGLVLVLLTEPVIRISFFHYKDKLEGSAFSSWEYWVWLVGLMICQAALLFVPVHAATNRPVTKKPVIYQILASGFMMGLLGAGLVMAIGEVIAKDAVLNQFNWFFFGGIVLVWIPWVIIFMRWSRDTEPKSFLEKQCRLLFRGSILELLIAVPTHIMVRGRDYCCAGFGTFVGIACGLAVMFFSFGPAVFFLFAARRKKLQPKA